MACHLQHHVFDLMGGHVLSLAVVIDYACAKILGTEGVLTMVCIFQKAKATVFLLILHCLTSSQMRIATQIHNAAAQQADSRRRYERKSNTEA